MTAPLSVKPVTLWDPVVRLTHWTIAVIVLVNAILTDGGGQIHVWAGWIGMAVLALRLLWGVLGPAEARFTAFPPSPRAALSHLATLVAGRPRDYPTHNPAGAAMAYALWATLAALMVSGLVLTGGATPMQIDGQRAAVAAGDWSVLVLEGDDDDTHKPGPWKKTAKEVHEVASNLILFLVALHIAGVVLESRALRRNLVKPMLWRAPPRTRK